MNFGSRREGVLRWSLALACFGLVIFFFSPSWGAFRLWARVPEMQGLIEVRRGVSVLQQIEHPGAEISDPLHRAIQWRLLFPIIGRVLRLPPRVFFSLADLGCLAVLGYIVSVLRRNRLTWSESALGAVMLGSCSWFFTSTGWLGYFDAWFALGLLLVAFAETRWAVWFACLWAPWVDERFALAAPFALLCRYLYLVHASRPARPGPADTGGETRETKAVATTAGSAVSFNPRIDWGVPAALLLAFVGLRLGVLSNHTSSGATVSGYLGSRDFLDAPLRRILLGVWEGLRAGWIFVVAAVILLRRRPVFSLVLGGVALCLVIGGLATAQDYSRSMTMLLPAALLGIVLAAEARPSWLPCVLRVGVVLALLLPAHHVMNDRVNPIYYLYHELAVLENPPAAAMPELYELRAIHKMERGEYADAEADLTLAIKLAENPSGPSRQRGILEASQGRWPDALRDFSTAAEHDPENPEAWFMRAQANFAVGQAAAARTDLDRALSLAPDGWSKRPDVTRFLNKLNQAGP